MHIHEVLALIHQAKQRDRVLVNLMFSTLTRKETRLSGGQRAILYRNAMLAMQDLSEALSLT